MPRLDRLFAIALKFVIVARLSESSFLDARSTRFRLVILADAGIHYPTTNRTVFSSLLGVVHEATVASHVFLGFLELGFPTPIDSMRDSNEFLGFRCKVRVTRC